MTNFWDRCQYVGPANGAVLWKCPKTSAGERKEFDCLFDGLEVIEDAHTFWILSDTPLPRFAKPFREAGKMLDRIADEVLDN